ncbi:MAG: proline racemase family protein [Cyclobacteriaceae bacterium]|nr:proline racemase family protein [Cyclobacteriaceae bacterium]
MRFQSQFEKLATWQPTSDLQITTIDAHTGGEPLRVITGGLPPIQGSTILERRRYMRENFDYIRKALIWEPRGHADMYGCIIMPPVTADADFGVLFLHNEGYSTMCGHGIIAITKVVLECGMLPIKEPATPINIDSPAGLIRALAKIKDNKVEGVSFMNVPSFVQAMDQSVAVEGIGKVRYDIAYGGAFYAYVDAAEVGVGMSANDHDELIEKGMAIKRAVMNEFTFKHPFEADLNFLYGTIFTGAALTKNAHSRNVCVFAEGEVDRSPTGTGVSGRMALHYAKGDIKVGEPMVIESIVASSFKCSVKETTKFGPYDAVIPEVEGTAYITGKHTFVIDPEDPLKDGFIFR